MGVHQVNVKFSDEEFERLERLRERIQAGIKAPGIKISQRQTILAALIALEAQYERSERDRGRTR